MDDPTEILIRIKPNITEFSRPELYSFNESSLTKSIQWVNKAEIKYEYMAESLYNEVIKARSESRKYPEYKYEKARRLINPFEDIPTGFFINRAGLKLANLDSLFNLTNTIGGKATLGRFYFADVAGGPGSWTQYIQYRRPMAIGYGITLRNTKPVLQWDKRLDYNRFNVFYGSDNSGNIYTQALNYVEYVNKSSPGIDLLVADGAFEVRYELVDQEITSIRLILAEILIGLLTVKPGGNMVVKLFGTKSRVMVDLIYLVSVAFDSITIIKPISSRPHNNETYLIGKNRRNNELITKQIKDILVDAWTNITDDKYPSRLITSVDPQFAEWITEINDIFNQKQLYYLTLLNNLLHGDDVYIPIYDTDRCLILWDLPPKIYEDKSIGSRRYNREYLELQTVVDKHT